MDDKLNNTEGYFKMHCVTRIVHVLSISFTSLLQSIHTDTVFQGQTNQKIGTWEEVVLAREIVK